MQARSFRFNLQELGGALGDIGTLLPLMVGLIVVNGLNATSVLAGAGLFYIASGLYFRVPTPVQPTKAVAAIAISLGLSGTVIGAAGLIMGAILLLLSLTKLISAMVKLFPRAVVRGIQLSIGLVLLRKGVDMAVDSQVFASGVARFPELGQFPVGILLAVSALLIFLLLRFALRQNHRFPPSLGMLTFGLGAGAVFNPLSWSNELGRALPNILLPSAADLWLALTALVIPQLPLTLGNAVVGTWDAARTYFGERAHRASPRALATSMGLANIVAGVFGAMPMCHGSGGLTAHYKLGARTGGANLMIGGLLLALGLFLGYRALAFFSMIPLQVLGVLLAIVGVYHILLVGDLSGRSQLAVAATVALTTVALGSLVYGFAAGIALHHLLRLVSFRPRHDVATETKL